MTEPRQVALEVLYELEQNPEATFEEVGLPQKTVRLVRGVQEHRAEIDQQIEDASEHWRLARMPVVDATVLRIGTFELMHDDTPVAVVINEAVELAKTYSTEGSGGFVNGLLSGVAEAVRTN